MIFYDTCNLIIYNNRARLSRDILIDRIFIVIIHYSQLMRIFAPENKDIQRFPIQRQCLFHLYCDIRVILGFLANNILYRIKIVFNFSQLAAVQSRVQSRQSTFRQGTGIEANQRIRTDIGIVRTSSQIVLHISSCTDRIPIHLDRPI